MSDLTGLRAGWVLARADGGWRIGELSESYEGEYINWLSRDCETPEIAMQQAAIRHAEELAEDEARTAEYKRLKDAGLPYGGSEFIPHAVSERIRNESLTPSKLRTWAQQRGLLSDVRQIKMDA